MRKKKKIQGYKVPFRRVYCNTFKSCVKQTIWCHFVIRIFPNTIDFNSIPLIDYMLNNPKGTYEQLEHMLIVAKEHNDKLLKGGK